MEGLDIKTLSNRMDAAAKEAVERGLPKFQQRMDEIDAEYKAERKRIKKLSLMELIRELQTEGTLST